MYHVSFCVLKWLILVALAKIGNAEPNDMNSNGDHNVVVTAEEEEAAAALKKAGHILYFNKQKVVSELTVRGRSLPQGDCMSVSGSIIAVEIRKSGLSGFLCQRVWVRYLLRAPGIRSS